MELNELHVLQRQSGSQHHRVTVAGTGMGRGTGKVAQVKASVIQTPGQNAPTFPAFHDQVQRDVFDEEFRIEFE